KLHEWREQGQRESARSYALEGNIDYRMQKYDQAIAAIKKAKELNAKAGKTDNPATWDQILAVSYAESGNTDEAVAMAKKRVAADPTDTTSLHNAVSLLVQAQRYAEAAELMETASKNGAIQSKKDYITMAKLYLVIAQNSDKPAPRAEKAVKLLEDGLAAGKLKPGLDIYKLQGDAAYVGGDSDQALAYYKKAAPFAKNGDLDVRRGQILASQGKNATAIKLIKSGIAKGVTHKGRAYLVLGAANSNASNRAAAIAAMKKAAQYPETKAKATRWLKKAGAA
ncbi:MAG: tetratricopeptide repeat protein, partial [Rhodanobacteraceae bacterium]